MPAYKHTSYDKSHTHVMELQHMFLLMVTAGCLADSPVKITVNSRKNETGHWIIVVDVLRETSLSSLPSHPGGEGRARGLDMHLYHNTGWSKAYEWLHMRATTTVSPTPTADAVYIPEGYDLVNGLGYYKLHSTVKSWEDARDVCVHEGGHLIVLNSEEEADVVRTMFSRKGKLVNATSENHTHMGFHDRYSEGNYVTVLGEKLSSSGYVHWQGNEPTGGTGQNCGLANADAKLYDNPCNWKLFFICEYKPA